jgi:hypothetical protein
MSSSAGDGSLCDVSEAFAKYAAEGTGVVGGATNGETSFCGFDGRFSGIFAACVFFFFPRGALLSPISTPSELTEVLFSKGTRWKRSR